MINSSSSSTSTLIPVRIDVVSDDRLLRVVDTILLDPTCWPISLCAPLHETVERNVTHLAHTVLSDAEVQGMSRTVRHFTGRTEIWSPRLQEKVEDQLRPQLWKIVNGQAVIANNNDADQRRNLIPISIRFIYNRVAVHEDIMWDPYGPLTVLEFARETARELNLPDDEGAVSIVTAMLEQLYGLRMDTSPDLAVEDGSEEEDRRGAWMLDAKTATDTTTQAVPQPRTATTKAATSQVMKD